MEKLKNINPGAVIRLGLLAASFVNMALNLGGHSPLSGGSTLSHIAAVAAACLAALVSYWKNNSFTEAAKQGDELMRALKEQSKKK